LVIVSGLSEFVSIGFYCSSMLMTRRINVVESDHHSSDDSMAASSIIMPISSSSAQQSEHIPSTTVHSVSAVSTIVTDDSISEIGSDSSSVSLISMPSSPSDDEDEALFHDSRSHTTAHRAAATAPTSGMDYVMLYDDNSSSEE
jgi:next to BRCA1 gene 1 protein